MSPVLASAEIAEKHETLHLRLSALLRQTEAIAGRRPDAPIPAATQSIAEGLLFDAQRFFRPRRDRRGLIPSAADMAGLAAQLGQALAGLDAFEARHSVWDGALNARVWRFTGQVRPVARLKPALATPPRKPSDARHSEMMRRAILRRLEERYENGYAAGLAAAASGALAPGASASGASTISLPAKKMSDAG